MQERDRRGPADVRGKRGECARQFANALVRMRDLHDAVDRPSAPQLTDLPTPHARVDVVRRRVHEDHVADGHRTRALQARRDLIDQRVSAAHHQPR